MSGKFLFFKSHLIISLFSLSPLNPSHHHHPTTKAIKSPKKKSKMPSKEELITQFTEGVVGDVIDIRVAGLDGEGVRALVAWMADTGFSATAVNEIDLGNNELTTGVELGELFAVTPNVRDIDLRENKLTKEALYDLQTPLAGLRFIHTLSLNGCALWDYGAEVVFNAVSNSKTLKQLHLSDNFFSEAAAPFVAKYIRRNTPLEVLHIDYNKLRDGLNEIAEALEDNTNLRTLGVNDNGIECSGCVGLQNVFTKNAAKITFLDLSVNNIGMQGCLSLSKGLMKNTHLQKIDLGANPEMTDLGVTALTACLRQNRALKHLDLTNCFLSDECVDPTVESMRGNPVIEEVTLMLNEDMSMEGKTRIVKIAYDNKVRNQQKAAVQSHTEGILFVSPSKGVATTVLAVLVVLIALIANYLAF